MAFKELKKAFEEQVRRETVFEDPLKESNESLLYSETCERNFRYWQLKLMFEIAGNLDSLVVSNRNAEKHIEKMANAYSDLVKLQKEKAQK